jgi:hypothetical protein
MVLDSTPCTSCNTTALAKLNKATLTQPQKKPSIAPEKPIAEVSQANRPATKPTRQPIQATGRIFLYVNFVGPASPSINAALVQIQTIAADRLKAEGFTVLKVPRPLKSPEAIAWVNQRAASGDIALAIQTDAFLNPNVRGAGAFYALGNSERQQQAQRLLQQVLQEVPELSNRGAKPDSETALGFLPFTRQAKLPAIVFTLGFETSPSDRAIIVQKPQQIAQGIVNGLVVWSRALSTPVYPSVHVRLNGKIQQQQGIVANDRAYVPASAIGRLKISLNQALKAKRLRYKNATYIRAIDLIEAGVFVGWNATSRTIVLRTAPRLKLDQGERIIGRGYLSQKNLEALLKKVNPQALQRFPEIARLYIEEAKTEGVNADIAFAQALLETNFFRFGAEIQPNQNNFAALRSVDGQGFAVFPNARIGVRAHIQQLKTYASFEPLAQAVVTPRFRFVARGTAPRIESLSGRYSADPKYGEEVLAIVGQLYRSIGWL